MKNLLISISFFVANICSYAMSSEIPDTANILDEAVVIERTAKAPVSLLPLDLKVVGSTTIDNSSEANVLTVLQNHVPGMFVTERGLAGYGVSGGSAGR